MQVTRHGVTRIRRDTRRRRLAVLRCEPLGTAMRRIWLTGEDLADFESASPDDHVKIFLPTEDGGTVGRDYTPRCFDVARRMLAIDFALHASEGEAGPATRWALAASTGDELEIGGPRGSTIVADDFDWYLLVGDETALPAIARRLEELRAGVRVQVLLSVAAGVTLPPFDLSPGATVEQVDRPAGGDPSALAAAAAAWAPTAGDGFVWIAGEAAAARAVRDALLERGHPREWMKAAGYWQAGVAAAHEKIGE